MVRAQDVKLIYERAVPFDQAQLARVLDDVEPDFEHESRPEIDALILAGRLHYGQMSHFILQFMFEGVLHVVMDTAMRSNEFAEAAFVTMDELNATIDAELREFNGEGPLDDDEDDDE